jgi:hypothetical protein
VIVSKHHVAQRHIRFEEALACLLKRHLEHVIAYAASPRCLKADLNPEPGRTVTHQPVGEAGGQHLKRGNGGVKVAQEQNGDQYEKRVLVMRVVESSISLNKDGSE